MITVGSDGRLVRLSESGVEDYPVVARDDPDAEPSKDV